MAAEEETIEQDQEQAEEQSAGEVAREFIQEVLAAMELPGEVQVEETEDGTWRLEVVGEEAGDLIGRYGSGINALQYLTSLVVQRETGQHVRVTLDADGYRDRRQAALVEQARALAAEVVKHGQEAELDPLGSFERRIIHQALTDDPDVITYSEGEGEDRRVIIAPRPKK
jgi:spoIIIJ-associated protein